MKRNIIYLHGFRSDNLSSKVKKLSKYLPNSNVYAPNLPADPSKSIKIIEKTYNSITNGLPIFFIGTSLGGFYALHSAIKFNLKCFIINPSLKPHISLVEKIGSYKTYNLALDYNFKSRYLTKLEKLHSEMFTVICNYYNNIHSYFNEDDEIIHHSFIESYKKLMKNTYFKTGGHRATNFEDICNHMLPELTYNGFYENYLTINAMT